MSKIPFSIEYRPLIESGEYKVEIGREDPWPARIVCWNLDGDNIIAVVMNPEGREEGLIYTKQGKHNAICPRIDSDLFIIIPEPELAESEDERIRRTLVEYFGPSAQLDFIRGVPIQKIRDWLEKQKEQKHTELTDEERMKNDKHFLSICQHLETLISESKNDEAKESIDKDYKWLCELYRKSRSAPEEENHKKSAEWSEEDKDKVAQYLHDRDGGMLWSKATEITRDILDMLRPSWKPSEE